MRQRRFAAAEPLVVGGYQALRASRGEDHPRTREARARAAAFYQAWGRKDETAKYRPNPRSGPPP